jgi:hypothetical protein
MQADTIHVFVDEWNNKERKRVALVDGNVRVESRFVRGKLPEYIIWSNDFESSPELARIVAGVVDQVANFDRVLVDIIPDGYLHLTLVPRSGSSAAALDAAFLSLRGLLREEIGILAPHLKVQYFKKFIPADEDDEMRDEREHAAMRDLQQQRRGVITLA